MTIRILLLGLIFFSSSFNSSLFAQQGRKYGSSQDVGVYGRYDQDAQVITIYASYRSKTGIRGKLQWKWTSGSENVVMPGGYDPQGFLDDLWEHYDKKYLKYLITEDSNKFVGFHRLSLEVSLKEGKSFNPLNAGVLIRDKITIDLKRHLRAWPAILTVSGGLISRSRLYVRRPREAQTQFDKMVSFTCKDSKPAPGVPFTAENKSFCWLAYRIENGYQEYTDNAYESVERRILDLNQN